MKIFANDSETRLVLQAVGKYTHTIDDDEENVLAKPGLLRVEEVGDVKVLLPDGSIDEISEYDNDPVMLVKKVYATGTTVPDASIKIYY